MEINLISGGNSFDSFNYQNINHLRNNLDQFSNAFLSEPKTAAQERLDHLSQLLPSLSPGDKVAAIEKEQTTIGTLFTDQRAELKDQLTREFTPRLSAQEIDLYLDDLQTAWGEKFNVAEHLNVLLSEQSSIHTQSPMALFQSKKGLGASPKASAPAPTAAVGAKSGADPALQQALADAEQWLNQPPSNQGETNLVNELISEINNLINSGGTLLDLQTWVTNFRNTGGDIFFYVGSGGVRPYFGIFESDITRLYTIAGLSAPSFSKMDDLISQTDQWLFSGPLSAHNQLALDMDRELLQLGFGGDPTSFTAWCQAIINNNFSAYSSMIASPTDIAQFIQISGANMTLSLALAETQEQLNNAGGAQPTTRFLSFIVGELNSLIGQGKQFVDFQQWIGSQFGTQDAYMQYLGLDQNAVQFLYSIGLQGTAPPPTAMDTLYANAYTWFQSLSPGSADYALAQTLVNEILTLGSQGEMTTLQSWVTSTFKTQDIYMQNPDATQGAIAQFYSLVGLGNPPTMTLADKNYKLAYDWLASLPKGPDANLASALVQEIASIGSNGDFSTVTTWAQNIVETGFSAYPSISGSAQTTFESISGAITALAYALNQAEAWQKAESGNPNSPAYKLATALVNEIKALGTGGTMQQLQNWIQTTFTGSQDVYWQYVGLSQTEAANLYTICGLGSAPAPTAMDTLYANAESWLQSLSPGSADYALAQTLVNEIQTLGSQGEETALQSWVTSTFKTQDIYMQNPDATQGGIAKFYSLVGLGNPPTITLADKNYKLAYDWLASLPKGPDANLASALVQEIASIGSNGNFSTVTTWAQNIVETGFSAYPSISGSAQTTFEQISGSMTALAYALNQAEAWQKAESGNPNSPAYKLATALVNEIEALGTGGTMQQLQNWIQTTFTGSQDVYWQYLGLSQSEAANLYTICGLKSTPAPTAMDTLYANAYTWLQSLSPGSADYALAQTLVNEIQTLGSQGEETALQSWVTSTFKTQDIYMQNPDATQSGIAKFYSLVGLGNPPASTLADQQYKLAYDWLASLPKGPDANLASALVQEIAGIGSNGDFSTVTTWAQNIVETGFSAYPSISGSAQTTFEQISGSMTALAYALNQAEAWQKEESGNPNSPAYHLATALVNEIKSLGTSGTMQQLQNWLKTTFTASSDIYWQYLGLSQTEAANLYSIAQAGSPPPITAMDTAYANAVSWLNTLSSGSPDFLLAQTLVSEIQTLGSQGSSSSLQSWINNTFASEDIYMQNPDASQTAINQFYAIAGMSAPTATLVDQKYKLAYDWRATLAEGSPDYNLASALVNEILSLGSFGNFSTVTNWAQNIVDTDFAAYPGVTNSAEATFENITGADTFANIKADIEAYLAQREAEFNQILSILHLPYPQTPAEWNHLLHMCATQMVKLESAMAECHSDADWLALGRTFGLSGNVAQIQAEASNLLAAYQGAAGYQSDVSLMTAALNEIDLLQQQHGSLANLETWAQGINLANYPNLSAADIAEFDKLLHLV